VRHDLHLDLLDAGPREEAANRVRGLGVVPGREWMKESGRENAAGMNSDNNEQRKMQKKKKKAQNFFHSTPGTVHEVGHEATVPLPEVYGMHEVVTTPVFFMYLQGVFVI
jgi:hypothetical protein